MQGPGDGKGAGSWSGGPTGTSFLPDEAVKRATAGSPIEKVKIAKDATSAFNSVYEFAAAVRAGTLDWEDVEKADMNSKNFVLPSTLSLSLTIILAPSIARQPA